MAKQIGIIKIEGTIDQLSFYKSGGMFIVRRKGGADATRIKNDPEFERTRENMREFKHIANIGTLLRRAFYPFLVMNSNVGLVGRMMNHFTKIRNLDDKNERGSRNVVSGLATKVGQELLLDFGFNPNVRIRDIFSGTMEVDKEVGSIAFIDFNPVKQIVFPIQASHLEFETIRAIFDFEKLNYQASTIEALRIPIQNITQTYSITPTQITLTGIVIQVVKINFYQQVNDQIYVLKQSEFSPVDIVSIKHFIQ